MRITKISPCRTDRSRVMVYFEDRSYCKVDMLRAKALDLKPGCEIDEKVLPELNEDSRRGKARETAARALGRRNMSSAELMRKLKDKGIAESDAEEAVQWAQDVGAIDDAAYAAMLLKHYRSKGFGDIRIRQEMTRRGISDDMCREILSEHADMTEEILDFLRKKLKGNNPSPDDMRRLTAALQRRGHSFSDIRAAFGQLEIEMEDTY